MDFKSKIKNIFSSPKTEIEEKHPALKEYEDLLINSKINREEWDKLFVKFYKKNSDYINDVENIEGDEATSRVIGIKIIYLRTLHDKGEFKEGAPITKDINFLLQRLDRNYDSYESTYINGKKLIGVNLAENKKHWESNKVFKDLIELDKNKEFYKTQIIRNTANILIKWCITPIVCICALLMIWSLLADLFGISEYGIGRPFFIVLAIILLIGLTASVKIEQITTYFVNKEYK